MFQVDNFLNQATPIINWLRMSLHATNANNRGPPETALALVAPCLAREGERDQPTLLVPSAKFNVLFTVLKSLLNIQDKGELPELWFTLAANKSLVSCGRLSMPFQDQT
jgi:hypothetical protein